MSSGALLVWIGALLIVGGLLFTAWQALRSGRLSVPRQSRPGLPADSLEPPARERTGGFSFKANWPGFALIALGVILMAMGAAL